MSPISSDDLPTLDQFMSLAMMTRDGATWRACHPGPGLGAAATAISLWDDPANVLGVVEDVRTGMKVIQPDVLDRYTQEGSWAMAEREMLETHWASVQAHPIYKWLSRRTGWSDALDSVDRKAKRAPASAYAHPLARFRFVSIAARNVGRYLTTKHGGRAPRVLTKAEARKGLAQIDAILKLLRHDAVVLPGDEAYELRDALEPLKEMLVTCAETRTYKERGDDTLLERRFIQTVAHDLNEKFGHVAPVLVSHIASIAGYAIHETTLRRILGDVTTTKS